MIKVEDAAILERDAYDEYRDPLPQKVLEDRTIYLSRNNYGKFLRTAGLVQITDFGFSVSGATPQSGPIQAELYRAPEVVVDAGFTYSADIWSLGVMVCSNLVILTRSAILMSSYEVMGVARRERAVQPSSWAQEW